MQRLKQITYHFFVLGLLAFSFGVFFSCNDTLDLSENGLHRNSEGLIGPYELEVAFDLENESNRTRADFEAPMINDLWVGMFDLTSRKIIASEIFEPYEGNDPVNDDHKSINSKVTLSNVYYNDDNPDVVIVGAANVSDIGVARYTSNGKEMGTSVNLKDVLTEELFTLEDFVNLAIDTKSAEEGASAGYPLLSGVMSTNHGNFTMDEKGKVLHDKETDPSKEGFIDYIWELFDDNPDDRFRKLNFKSKNLKATSGMIHLRRMVSKVSVEITTNNGVEIDLDKSSFQVYNIPNAIFFQERTIVENPGSYTTKEAWKKVTPAASDIIEDGYSNSDVYGNNQSGNEPNFEVHEGEGLREEDGTIKFSYWHYENKHWGLNSITEFHQRESRFENSEVFSSLCPDESKPFNNNATYFVFKTHITDTKNNLEGDVEYLIHEGYCCQPNSVQSTNAEQAARDFSTFRNTNYTYNIEIAGIKNIYLSVTKDENSNPGATGDISSDIQEDVVVPNTGGSYLIGLPDNPDDFLIEVFVEDEKVESQDEFYKNITIGGYSIDEFINLISTFSKDDKFELVIPDNEEDERHISINCKLFSSDGRSSYACNFIFKQNGSILDTPIIYMAPGTPDEIILGLNDHTIYWEPIKRADYYTITLVETNGKGGYTIDLKPGIKKQDSGGLDVILNEDPETGILSFKMRYANSQKALMNLVDEKSNQHTTATFEVIAKKDSGKESNPGRYTHKICNPVWDFREAEFKNAVYNYLGTQYGEFTEDRSFTLNGLSVNPGNLTSNFMKFDSTKIDHIAFGGAGNTTRRNFSFHPCSKGKLTLYTSSNGNAGSGRKIEVSFSEGDPIQSTNDANATASGTQTTITINNVDEPNLGEGEVKIYPTGDIWMWYIKFTPEDR